MSMPYTATLGPKRLVSPCTSMARLSERADIDGLSGVEGQAARRARFDLEDQLLAVADREDHGRGELLLGGDEADGRGQVLGATVAMDGDLPAELHLRELRLRHEEAHIDIGGWKDRDHRRHRRRIFTGAEEDVLDSTFGARDDDALGELIGRTRQRRARLGFGRVDLRDEGGRGVVSRLRLVERLLRGGARAQQALLPRELLRGEIEARARLSHL